MKGYATMATFVLLMTAAILALVVVNSVRKAQEAPALLVIERTPRRIRRNR
jgi:hypothetical protein